MNIENDLKKVLYILRFLIVLGLLCSAHASFAQEKTVPRDSSHIKLRQLSASSIHQYRQDDDFNYNQQRAAGISMWDRFWYWVFESIGKVGNDKFWSVFFKILLWGLCIFAAVYIILKSTGMDKLSLFMGNKKSEALDYLVTEEDIYAINFSAAIDKALQERNYRLATRLLYLHTLRTLADRELITWKLSKTNNVYVYELRGTPLYDAFAYLTRAYEYAWYGEFPLQESIFKELQARFTQFQQQMAAV